MTILAQAAFTAGELSPLAHGRTDLTKYGTGLRTCKNMIIRPHGCVMNRSGTTFTAVTNYSGAQKSRLVPFVFSDDQSYILEFSAGLVRVYLGDSDGLLDDFVTTYTEADLENLQYAQSADVLTLTLQRLPQQEVRRSGFTFSMTQPSYDEGPFLSQNTDTAITVQASAVTGAITITASAGIFDPLHVGGLFRIEQEDVSTLKPWEPTKVIALGVASPVGEIRTNDGKTYQCTAAAASATNTATGTVPPTHDFGAERDGDGNGIASFATVCGVTWTYLDSGFGVVRITGYTSPTQVTATVLRRLPSVVVSTTSSLWTFGAWSPYQGYPATLTYFQDRLFYAGTTGQPQAVWASKTGRYDDFGTSVPSQDDDSLAFFLNARKINAITDLIALESLLVNTKSGVFRVTDGQDEVLTPSTLGFKPQNYIGGSRVRSEIIGDSAVYPQADGRRVRDLFFQLEIDKFTGPELSILAEHLFPKGTAITQLDYAQYPFSLLHVARDDGVMPTLAYLREQDVLGWSPWETDGVIEDVCSVPTAAGVSRTSVIVRRVINGVSVRLIERFTDREFADTDDGHFVDAGTIYDGRSIGVGGPSLTLTGGTLWTTAEALTLLSDTAMFAAGDVADQRHVWLRSGDDMVRVLVTGYTSTLIVSVVPFSTVPASLRGVVTQDFTLPKRTIAVGSHLNGASVRICADSMDVDPQVVSGGNIVLDHPGGVVHVGLGYTSDIETLDFNVPGGESVRSRRKTIPEVSVLLNQTRGLEMGPDVDHLDPLPPREYEAYTDAADLDNDIRTMPITTGPNKSGRVYLRQSAPLPMTIVGLLPNIEFGE